MGLYTTVLGLVNRWKDGNRKRKADNEPVTGETPAKKKIASYILTPDQRQDDVKLSRRYGNYYVQYEELHANESRTMEFKAGGVIFTQELHKLIQKYASAFFNSQGGVLLAGVQDNGVVVGVKVGPREKQRITEITTAELKDFRPTVTKDMWSIKWVPVSSTKSYCNDLVVVEFSFEKGGNMEVYETGNHEVYMRRDGGVHGPLRPLQIRNLVITKYNETLKSRKATRGSNDKENITVSLQQSKNTIPTSKQSVTNATTASKQSVTNATTASKQSVSNTTITSKPNNNRSVIVID